MNFQKSINRSEFNVKFYVHVFPTEKFDWDNIKTDIGKKVLYIKYLFEFHSSVNIKPLQKFWCFKTDTVFMNSCQNEIYSTIGSQIFRQIRHGTNHTIMSYGQNYSGKSFTMSGLYNQFELRGIIPRFVVELFSQLETAFEDYTPKVYLSVVDIYNNCVYDLLSHKKVVCNELKNVNELEVVSGLECLELLFKAEAQRMIVQNKSYRSHCSTNVVTLKLILISANSHEPVDKISKINFVDLAGVESVFRNPLTSFKDRYKQGDANVTKSLLELYALCYKKYNTSQNINILTKYLNKSFSSTASIYLICHIRPHKEDIKITLSSLKFGKIFQGIPVVRPEEHSENNYDMIIKKLNEEIKTLKDELSMIDSTDIKTPIQMSQERIDFAKRTVHSFLDGELTEKDLLSLIEDPLFILNILKSIVNQPIAKSSVIVQTEFLKHPMDGKFEQQEIVMNDKTEESSTKRPSARKVSAKLIPGKKTSTAKSNIADKVAVQSEEIQVNLLEPKVTLPNFESRESLWAKYLISKPDMHTLLERLNASVSENNKKLNYESSIYDAITQSISKKQLTLNQLVTHRHVDKQEVYDHEGKVLVPQAEANLVQELNQLSKELDENKQRLINAQFDWLEALEKLRKEKEIIDKDFTEFCVENNFVATENNLIEESSAVKQDQSWLNEDFMDFHIKKVYCSLQKKHLHKLKI